MFSFVDLQKEFDIVSWSITLHMFFLMARKSNFLPISVKDIDSTKQLVRQDIEVFEDLLFIVTKHISGIRKTVVQGLSWCQYRADAANHLSKKG